MPTYTVSVIAQGVDLTDDVLETLFSNVEDVVPSWVNGALKVTAPVKATDDQTAALRLIEAVEVALPHVSVTRLDQDLVSIADIAERTSRSRESVRLLVDGKRGPGEFPIPIGTVGDAIRVWPWDAVLTWFRDKHHEDLGERSVSPETAALIDARLYGKVQLGPRRAAASRPTVAPAKTTKKLPAKGVARAAKRRVTV